jgi:hypothetical protein
MGRYPYRYYPSGGAAQKRKHQTKEAAGPAIIVMKI